MSRNGSRKANELRPVKIIKYFQHYPAGSVLIEMGNTRVVCSAFVENRVPNFARGTGTGWLKAEYSLLPGSTAIRSAREAVRGRQTGRTMEIQRLIGRSLRAVLDLKALGERTIIIDCDVIQADGGTRTASITGSYIAMVLALADIIPKEKTFPVTDFMAAVSVGIDEENNPVLDLCYDEDSRALVDMNVVMTGEGNFVELQGTGEGRCYSRSELDVLLGLAEKGNAELISYEKDVLGGEIVWRVGRIN